MTGNPIRQIGEESLTPGEALKSELGALCDLLVLKPMPERAVLRDRVLRAVAACEKKGETGLVAHLLRNLLRDLAPRSAPVDTSYYAEQLGQAAKRMKGQR